MIEGVGGESTKFADRLIQGAHQIDLMRLEQARLAWDFTLAGHGHDYCGCESPVHFLRMYAHMSWSHAQQAVCVGSMLDQMPGSVAALERGEIGFDHLAVIASTGLHISEKGDWGSVDEQKLLERAREETVGAFRQTCEQARHVADAEGFLQEQVALTEGRSLRFSTGELGLVYMNGVLDPAAGAAVKAVLRPLARKQGKDDDRLSDKRWADALVELCEHGASSAHVQVTTTLETLRGLPGAPAGLLESVPISAKTVERMTCDCTLTRVLLSSDSVVIDVGRGHRIVTGPPRRALNARDQHCRFPGCERPASWCTPHHLVHWAKGGGNDLPNQLLLGSRHHGPVAELARLAENLVDLPVTVHVLVGGVAHDGAQGGRAEAVLQLLSRCQGSDQPPRTTARRSGRFRVRSRPGQAAIQPHRAALGRPGGALQALAAGLPLQHHQRTPALRRG